MPTTIINYKVVFSREGSDVFMSHYSKVLPALGRVLSAQSPIL